MDYNFADLASLNVNEHVEQKGQLSYLSWVWAVDKLFRLDPQATWEVQFFDGRPYSQVGETAMVFVKLHALGVTRLAFLPVMDNRNRPIPNPDSFSVNTALMRCLTKAIALLGIGLYIYAGEDLPPDSPESKDAAPAAPKETAPAESIGAEDLKTIRMLLSATGVTEAQICAKYQIKNIKNLPPEKVVECVKRLQEILSKETEPK